MKRRNRVLLVLLALSLVFAMGAKMYSSITMGDNEWIGLGASAGRIVFDNQATDEVNVMDANFGVNTTYPVYDIDVLDDSSTAYIRTRSTSGDAGIKMDAHTGSNARLYWLEGAGARWGLHYYGANDYLRLYNYATSHTAAYFKDNDDILLAPNAGKVKVGSTSAPAYDLDVDGDIRATDDVFVNDDLTVSGNVFIGSAEDADEDGARMHTRADNDEGGYVFWTYRNLVWNWTTVFESDTNGGDTGPDSVFWVQWLVKDNNTGLYTEGDAILTEGTSVLIANDGERNIARLEFDSPTAPGTKGRVGITMMGSHTYDVALLIMWVED
jgi:hypothetical protein